MTDAELTRLAFKAAFGGAEISDDKDMLKRWSPLTDDGDALRLAVTLGIGTRHHKGWSEVFYPRAGLYEFEQHGDCVFAATRRAIVRAAAEIGKEMP